MNSKCLARCWFGPDDSKWRSKGFFKTGPHRHPFYPSSCVISSSSARSIMLFISQFKSTESQSVNLDLKTFKLTFPQHTFSQCCLLQMIKPLLPPLQLLKRLIYIYLYVCGKHYQKAILKTVFFSCRYAKQIKYDSLSYCWGEA